jgi:hypothetical protein
MANDLRPIEATRLVRLIGGLRKFQDTPAGYAIAAGLTIGAIGVRDLLDPYFALPYVLLFPNMVIAALVGGRRAGILAAIIGGLAAWYLWMPPRRSWNLEWPTGYLSLALYAFSATIILLAVRSLNEAMRTLEAERDLSSTLFKELQHRTANNLQVVSAMLQRNRDLVRRHPEAAPAVIDAAATRFEVMSRINRLLYSPDMQIVQMGPFLETLTSEILGALGSSAILVTCRPCDVELSRTKAMVLSSITAELLTNSAKHAFVGPGSVVIGLERKEGTCIFTYSDDGRGYDTAAMARSDGLGSRIIAALVAQIGGTIKTRSGPGGTSVTIRVPAA